MKFVHISDLHIGKRINEFPMIEDQKYILGQILEIAGCSGAQGVLIAGDIYDKQSPSAEAVQVFDWFLTALAELGKRCLWSAAIMTARSGSPLGPGLCGKRRCMCPGPMTAMP